MGSLAPAVVKRECLSEIRTRHPFPGLCQYTKVSDVYWFALQLKTCKKFSKMELPGRDDIDNYFLPYPFIFHIFNNDHILPFLNY